MVGKRALVSLELRAVINRTSMPPPIVPVPLLLKEDVAKGEVVHGADGEANSRPPQLSYQEGIGQERVKSRRRMCGRMAGDPEREVQLGELSEAAVAALRRVAGCARRSVA